MHTDYQYSTSRLLKIYLEKENKAELVLPPKDTLDYHVSKEDAIKMAKSLKINKVLIGEMNRTGEIVIIAVSIYNTETGEKEWGALQKALSPDDLDLIMQRIANSIINRHSIDESEDIYNVTDYDSKELNKKEANSYFGIEIGGGPVFVDVDNNTPAGFSLIYSGDIRTMIFDVKGSAYFGDVKLLNLNIRLNYPFLNKASSPYFGGGLGYGRTTLKQNDNNNNNYYYSSEHHGEGLTVFLGGGYILNRTSNINLRVNMDIFYSMYEVKEKQLVGILFGVMVLF